MKRPEIITWSQGHGKRDFPHLHIGFADSNSYDVWMSVDELMIAPDGGYNMIYSWNGNDCELDETSKDEIRECKTLFLLLRGAKYI